MVHMIEFNTCTLLGGHFLVLYLSHGKGIFWNACSCRHTVQYKIMYKFLGTHGWVRHYWECKLSVCSRSVNSCLPLLPLIQCCAGICWPYVDHMLTTCWPSRYCSISTFTYCGKTGIVTCGACVRLWVWLKAHVCDCELHGDCETLLFMGQDLVR